VSDRILVTPGLYVFPADAGAGRAFPRFQPLLPL